MEQENIPTWFTKELVIFPLEDLEKTEIIIDDLQVESAIPKGVNLMSTILRTTIVYRIKGKEELRKKSLILKKLVDEYGEQKRFMEREYKIYTQLITKIVDILGEDLTPKIYRSPEEEILIMEDLKEAGYELHGREEQLNFEETAEALSSLAKFHAAALKIIQENPGILHELGEDIVHHFDTAKKIVKPICASAMEIIKTWPEFKDYHKCFDYLTENICKTILEVVKPKEGAFNVLNHGDFHLYNMMFKNVLGNVKVKLIDFQATLYASPAYDLREFLTLSIMEDVREKRFEELLRVYLKALNETLVKIGSKQRLEDEELFNSMNDLMILDLYFTVIAFGFYIRNISVEENDPVIKSYKIDFFRERLIKNVENYTRNSIIWKNDKY